MCVCHSKAYPTIRQTWAVGVLVGSSSTSVAQLLEVASLVVPIVITPCDCTGYTVSLDRRMAEMRFTTDNKPGYEDTNHRQPKAEKDRESKQTNTKPRKEKKEENCGRVPRGEKNNNNKKTAFRFSSAHLADTDSQGCRSLVLVLQFICFQFITK